jgi:hypothetical protein
MNTYVLSTGRTGTKFLSEKFNRHFPQLKLTHQRQGSRIINIVANLPLTNGVYLSFLRFLFRLFGRGYPPHSTIDPLLSLAIYKFIKYGDVDQSKCLIIHLVRSPENFVTSFMNWKQQSIKRTFLHHFVPFWNPVPFFHKCSLFSWIKMSQFEKFCWVWNYKNSCFSTLGNQNYFMVRMEDLFKYETKKQSFEDLGIFLRLRFNDDIIYDNSKKINESKIKKFPLFQGWTRKQKIIMFTHCGKLSKKMKYNYNHY